MLDIDTYLRVITDNKIMNQWYHIVHYTTDINCCCFCPIASYNHWIISILMIHPYEFCFAFLGFLMVAFTHISWWRHEMKLFSTLLTLCAGNSPVTGEFPSQRPVTRSFEVFFDLRLNKWLSKQSRGWCFETPSRPSWRHCNDSKPKLYVNILRFTVWSTLLQVVLLFYTAMRWLLVKNLTVQVDVCASVMCVCVCCLESLKRHAK